MSSIRRCVARDCPITSLEAKLYGWPRDKEMALKWRQNLRISPDAHIAPTNTFICGAHFPHFAVGGQRLKRGAVPTLNLGPEEDVVLQHSIEEAKGYRSCCVEGCSPHDDQTLFGFPRTEVAFNNWALVCNLKVSFPPNTKICICERHFHNRYLTKTRLLKGAFPLFNLPPQIPSEPNSCSSELILQPVKHVYMPIKSEGDLTLEQFEQFSDLEVKRQRFDVRGTEGGLSNEPGFCDHEPFARAARIYQGNARKQDIRIEELQNENVAFKQQIARLQTHAIIASPDCSDDALNFARMIVRSVSSYTDTEKTLAQNINYMSTKAYNFMRDDLKFSLPHKKSPLR
ncbi:PREDICTED: uncharacterized protein LOC108364945 [Rhagoletis zephyria]|uniref:uncharacterized protein LOC108364945 n=1 Tax=Rhagoletis zephyria TaxID=28612 RepID=UPI00081190CC|nr:PREDICTED: uncharacterized protein LOC108364945 [Rhagoletis zephyria]